MHDIGNVGQSYGFAKPLSNHNAPCIIEAGGVDILEQQPTTGHLNRRHRDTMFRGLFKEPQNFLYLLKHCSDDETSLTADDITPFDLESALAIDNKLTITGILCCLQWHKKIG